MTIRKTFEAIIDTRTVTHDNTDYTYTTDELSTLNEALAARIADGERIKSAIDAINNLWFDGATAADLI